MAITEIHILHHTHVDVGYTDFQPVIRDDHVEFINLALDYCTATDDYPHEAMFRWINEFSWAVTSFLEQCPNRAEELFARLREGRMELCGLFVDPTELYDRRSLEEALRPALGLARDNDFEITTVMTTDVPGQGWSLADVMVEQGLSYLSVSPNSMVSRPVQVERPFWWIGPRGNRVLVWLTDWRNGWYGEGHVLGFREGIETATDRVRNYLDLLDSEGYPWQALALHMGADNYPPFRELSDLVCEWNARAELPPVRLSTNRDFMERMLKLHGESFPSRAAAWPCWWSEGIGSAAYEAALSRETHCTLERIEALQRQAGDESDLWPIFEDLLLFDEHTWGCQSMALNPHSFMSRATWTHKSLHIYRAADASRRLERELSAHVNATPDGALDEAGDHRDATLHESGPGATGIAMFNPLPDGYRGPVTLPALGADITQLAAPDGNTAPVQHSPATQLAEGGAVAVVSVRPGESLRLQARASDTPAPQQSSPSDVLENEFYRVRFSADGTVVSVIDVETGAELLDQRAPWGFGETIQECIQGDQDRGAVWERGYTEIPYGKRRTDAPFRREGSFAGATLLGVQRGPVFHSVTWRSELPFVRYMETEVRLWNGLKRIDVEVRLDKQPCEAYESLYVAFPFALEQPRAIVHSCDAVFEAEAQQLPGTCRDYYVVQHFAALQGMGRWAAVCPVDAPLVQFGAITFGRWAERLTIDRGCIYSWLTNNFWYTNFPGYQLGELRFRFSLTTGDGEMDAARMEALGRSVRVGLSVT